MLHDEPPRRSLSALCLVGLLCLLALCTLWGCKRPPKRGAYDVRVVAMANASQVVKGADIFIHGQRVGHTDAFGVYRGTIRGQVGSQIQLKVVGKGQNNYYTAKIRLRVKQVDGKWRFTPIRVRALLVPQATPQNAPVIRPMALTIRPQPLDTRANPTQTRQPNHRGGTTTTDDDNCGKIDAVKARAGTNTTTASGPPPVPTGVKKTQCFNKFRGAHRVVVLHAPPGSICSLIGDCIERVGKVGPSGKVSLSLPIGQFPRFMVVFPSGKSVRKVAEITNSKRPLMLHFSSGNNQCNMTHIQRKLRNRIVLEQEEINCLKREKRGSPHYFSAWLFLSRAFCTHKKWRKGAATLDALQRDPRNRYNPYRALQMGIEYGRCRKYSKAIPLLKRAESQVHRMAVADRYKNKKALHSALTGLYEQRFRRRKRASDINLSLKHARRLAEITMSREPAYCRKVLAEVKRLKKLANRHGDIDE